MYQDNSDLFSPYKGDQPYIFISYSHRNSAEVMDIISKLQQLEFRVWYDKGIDPGTEWDENIAAHITGCAYFIAFISDEYLASSNCKDELNFARDKDKPRLLIYLKDTRLPEGMSMRLNRLQAIHKYTYTRELDFYQKVIEADGIGVCRKNSKAQQPKKSAGYSAPVTPVQNVQSVNAPKPKKAGGKKDILSLICGILSPILMFAPDFWQLTAIAAGVAAIVLASSAKKAGIVNVKTKVGKILGIISLSLLGLIVLISFIAGVVVSVI